MPYKKTRTLVSLLVGSLFIAAAVATEQTSSIIKTSDKAALDAAKETDVVVEGVCSTAAWSSSGKVMNIDFVDAEESKFAAVVFQRNQQKLDEAFNGDAAKSFTGAKLRIKGRLREYGGKAESMKGRLEITILEPSQVTILEPATTQPASSD